MSEYVGTEDIKPTPPTGSIGPVSSSGAGGLAGAGGRESSPTTDERAEDKSAMDKSAKDKAAESVQAGKQAAGDVAQTAADKAAEVVGETKTQARNVVGEARDQLRGHAGDQHRNAVTNLHGLADELHSMARSGEQSGVAADVVGHAADRTREIASWLEDRQPEDLVEELRRFARRRPGAFLVGALAAGVVAGRLTRGMVATHTGDNADDADLRPGSIPSPASPSGNDLGSGMVSP